MHVEGQTVVSGDETGESHSGALEQVSVKLWSSITSKGFIYVFCKEAHQEST